MYQPIEEKHKLCECATLRENEMNTEIFMVLDFGMHFVHRLRGAKENIVSSMMPSAFEH